MVGLNIPSAAIKDCPYLITPQRIILKKNGEDHETKVERVGEKSTGTN